MSPMLADRFELNNGSPLGPNYTVLNKLGEGTYGIVYRVRSNDQHGAERAAKVLKLYNNPSNVREDIARRFEREFECARIKSPHLVAATEKGMIKGNPFFVMEYCPNGSAKNWVGRNKPFSDIDRFAQETLLGLKALHENGVIHRDLKPDNILLDALGNAKLTDFGIAGYQNSRMTRVNLFGQAKDIFGTYAYIAPEQANSRVAYKALGPAADMWSFGVTMYEIITGYLPFGALEKDADLGEYMKRASQGTYPPLSRYRGDVPPKWEELIRQCLDHVYRKRISNAEDALNILGFSGVETPDNTFDFYRDMFGLQVMHGEEPGRIYNLSRAVPGGGGEATLGWFDDGNPYTNTLTIVERQTKFVSRYHATIVKDPIKQCWLIKDGQFREKNGIQAWHPSTNGTLVNSEFADHNGLPILPGDIITVGDTTLKVVTRSRY
ncbi:MAG: protein kinase domain-containing protein [Phaeodactylibacter xiamenensis]|uniref:serine/threonine-protein kinase n=1 Tax=Phaeodactylibacter xiamenensis TaxID=1524460 RepID=UPI0006972DE2|nr:serine/threonine-protein kinase [Phaeodactylibacter xiamenensis]MCR9051201.1 FHA domain-containing serine/threonine-protein kinase [bacterium]